MPCQAKTAINVSMGPEPATEVSTRAENESIQPAAWRLGAKQPGW